jgi:hypothetical protein
MSILTAIAAVTVFIVAWVGVSQLQRLNTTVEDIVNRTFSKVNLANEIRFEFMLSVRDQKNAVLSTDDKASTEYAKASETAMLNAQLLLELQSSRLPTKATMNQWRSRNSRIDCGGYSDE